MRAREEPPARVSRRAALRTGLAAGTAGLSLAAGPAAMRPATVHAALRPEGLSQTLELDVVMGLTLGSGPVTISRLPNEVAPRGDWYYEDGSLYAAGQAAIPRSAPRRARGGARPVAAVRPPTSMRHRSRGRMSAAGC
jgi:hypothetical protein